MGEVRCPRCGQGRGRRCSRAGAVERALGVLYVYPFRCRVCGARFRAFQWGRRYARLDRRNYERVPVHLPATVTSRDGVAEGAVTDLSLGGCGVKSDLHPVTGDQVRLSVRLTRDTRPVEITAAVHSVHTGALGLEFTEMGAADRQRLHHFLASLIVTDSRPGWAGRATPASAAVWLVALVTLLGAFVVVRLWPAFTVCIWGRTC